MSHGHPTDSQPADGQGPPRGQSPWTRPWFIASAAAVVLIVALGIAYAMIPSGGHTNAAPAPTPTATPTGTAGAGQDSACGLPAGDQRYPSVGLPTKWELLGRVAVPTDPQGIGPGRVDGTVRTCYQHSPTGALYAAANIVGTGFLPDGQTIILKDLAAESPARDQALATPSQQDAADTSLSLQIAGFKVISYTGDTARISLGLKASQNGGPIGYGSMTFGLCWEGGDWKAIPEETSNSSGLQDLSDFVPWTGV